MSEGQIEVVWEYLSEPIPPMVVSSDIPVEDQTTTTSLRAAIGIMDQLKQKYGKRLLSVDIIMRIFGM